MFLAQSKVGDCNRRRVKKLNQASGIETVGSEEDF
jgi:hypothetical protein